MNKSKIGLKTKITIFILGAVYLPLIILSIFSETFGELNRTELISEMAKGKLKTELMITKSQQTYMRRTMKDYDHQEVVRRIFRYLKVNKNLNNIKNDPSINNFLDETLIEEGKLFPTNATTYYHYAIYLEDGSALYTIGKDFISDSKLSEKVNALKFPKISEEKKSEILNDFKNLEPYVVYAGKFKVIKEIGARTNQGVKMILEYRGSKILIVANFLLLPSSSKVPRLRENKLGDKSGVFIFNQHGISTFGKPFTIKELLPDAPPLFFLDGINLYKDPKGNLFVKGEVKSKIRGQEKTTKVLYFPNKIIYGPWDYFSNLLIGIIVLFAIITVPLLLYFLKKYISPLEDILDKLQSSSALSKKASTELETTSTELAEASIESSSGMENIVKSMEKINLSQESIKKSSESANRVHLETSKIAQQSEVGNIEMIKSMNEMAQAAENIGSITDIIEDISFQTNLLSLNASVEAARAGEQGKGFGVVASSIRELSGKTSESAKEISELISEAIKKSKSGSIVAKENSDIIIKIINNISQSLDTVKNVNTSLENQSESMGPLNEGIAQMNNISKVSVSKAIACNKISKDLAKSTEEMDKIIKSLGGILEGGH
ncbi:MAG: hypothetical protein E2O68_06405 [Deltaproteobacteria bacterium]|nr:MAG: hypothetical protein E2O68_06405 [Deltaproteobacteria bacterium]